MTPTRELLETPTSAVKSEPTMSQNQTESNETNDSTSPLTAALLPVALLLLSIVGIVILRAARANARQ